MLKPKEVKAAFGQKESENWAFRTYLKIHADPEVLDNQINELHNELFSQYDCSQCRNCCKEYAACLTEAEIGPAAALLKQTETEFKERYLKEEYGEYIVKTKPCSFLQANGDCALESCRPQSCKEYPYTDKPDRLTHLISIIDAASVCPVVFEMLERLKQTYHWRWR